MESDQLKEIDIENCKCYYFDDIIKIENFDLDNILTDEKSYENMPFLSFFLYIFVNHGQHCLVGISNKIVLLYL